MPLRGVQDFGHYKCIAANELVPSDEKLIKINQISKLKKLVYFDKRKTIYRVNILFGLYSLSPSGVLEVKAVNSLPFGSIKHVTKER